ERVTEGEDKIADANLVRVAKGKCWQACRINLQHCEIAWRVGTHEFGGEGAIVSQFDLDFEGAVNYVMVGQNVTVSIDDDARANLLHALRWLLWHLRHPVAEKVTEVRVVHEWKLLCWSRTLGG